MPKKNLWFNIVRRGKGRAKRTDPLLFPLKHDFATLFLFLAVMNTVFQGMFLNC